MLMLTLLICVACTPLSTIPFDPNRKVSVEEQQVKQTGLPEIYSGMPCADYYKAQLGLCYSIFACPVRELREYQRGLQRTRTSFSCKIYFGNDAKAIIRGR